MTELPDVVQDIATDERAQRFARYLLVGLVGVGINQGVLFLATGVAGISYVIGGTLSRAASILANYAMNDSWTWRSRGAPGLRGWTTRGAKYVATRLVGVAIGLVALVVFVELFGLHYLVANVLAIGVGVMWGFGASERWVWRPESAADLPTADWTDQWRDRLAAYRSAIDRPTLAVLGLAAVLFVAFTLYTVALYRGYRLTGSDFGSYVHMFSTTLSGEGFLLHGKYRVSHPGGSYWGAHFSLTLLLFLPLYALAPYPETLLVAKSFVLAASVPALWFVARAHLESDYLAGLVVVSYALNPWLWSGWAFDFQEQALLPLFVFVAYYYYVKGRWGAFLVATALALVTNEFTIIILAGFLGGLLFAAYRRGRLIDRGPVLLAALALAVVARALAGAVMERNSEFSGIPDASIADAYKPFVDGIRVSVVDLVGIALTNPDVLWEVATKNASSELSMFLLLVLPVAFLCLADDSTVGALVPYLGFAWLLAGRSVYFRFGAHYPLYLVPIVYIGTVRVLVSLTRWRFVDGLFSTVSEPTIGLQGVFDAPAATLSRLRRRVVGHGRMGLFARLLLVVVLVNATVGLAIQWGAMKPASPATDDPETLEAAIDAVPHDASLVTQNDIYPHVASRPSARYLVRPDMFATYQRTHGTIAPEYVLYDTGLSSFWAAMVAQAFGDRLGEEYGLYGYENGVWLFQRGYDGPATEFTSGRQYEWVAEGSRWFDPAEFAVRNGQRTAFTIVSDSTAPEGTIWYGPYVALPAGDYSVTFQVKTTGSTDEAVAVVDVAAGEGHTVLASESVSPGDDWQSITLEFTLDRPRAKVEFRGHREIQSGTVELVGVSLTPRDGEDDDE